MTNQSVVIVGDNNNEKIALSIMLSQNIEPKKYIPSKKVLLILGPFDKYVKFISFQISIQN